MKIQKEINWHNSSELTKKFCHLNLKLNYLTLNLNDKIFWLTPKNYAN